jgi:arylsulfatase A-like enzyme
LLVRWPGVIAPGTTLEETVCLTDLYATSIAAADGAHSTTAARPDRGGEDSIDLVPLLADGDATLLAGRAGIVHHSLDGMFAIRVGDWKLIEGLGSGGFTAPKRRAAKAGEPTVQLYDLATDPFETKNIAAQHPDEVARLQAILDQIRADVRTHG